MSIELLIAPITKDNIVNNIHLQKASPIPFASKLLPNSKRQKNYTFKYNNKMYNSILQTLKAKPGHVYNQSLEVKASANKRTKYDASNEQDYYNFIKNASIYELKKVKPSDYAGVRVGNVRSNNGLLNVYNFTERWFAPLEEENEGVYLYDQTNINHMTDPSLFRSVFVDKHSYIPILPSSLEGSEETGYQIATPSELLNYISPSLKTEWDLLEDEKNDAVKNNFENSQYEPSVKFPSTKIDFQLDDSETEDQSKNLLKDLSRKTGISENKISKNLKRKRNNLIRKVLEENGLDVPSRISESFIENLFTDESGYDPNVLKELQNLLKKNNLLF